MASLSLLSLTFLLLLLQLPQFPSWNWPLGTRRLEADDDNTKCLCYVPIHGLYNGIELNKLRGKALCKPNLYYCAKNNYFGIPKLELDCSRHFGCYYQSALAETPCTCPKKLVDKNENPKTRGPRCGNKLKNCESDLLFYCFSETDVEYIGTCEMGEYFNMATLFEVANKSATT